MFESRDRPGLVPYGLMTSRCTGPYLTCESGKSLRASCSAHVVLTVIGKQGRGMEIGKRYVNILGPPLTNDRLVMTGGGGSSFEGVGGIFLRKGTIIFFCICYS